jgi:hypothetical protein
VTTENKEFRIKSGNQILNYIENFKPGERVIFGLLLIMAIMSSLFMVKMINDHFSVKIPVKGGSVTEGLIGLPRNINPVIAITDTDRDIS